MKRDEIQRRVEDAVGVILVDKSVIEENSTLEELVLDDEDIEELFDKLDRYFGISPQKSKRKKARKHPESTTLASLIDWYLTGHASSREKNTRNPPD